MFECSIVFITHLNSTENDYFPLKVRWTAYAMSRTSFVYLYVAMACMTLPSKPGKADVIDILRRGFLPNNTRQTEHSANTRYQIELLYRNLYCTLTALGM